MKSKIKSNDLVRKGQLLLKESPFVYVLKSSLKHERCDLCFESGQVLKKCSACKYVSYCDRTCQKTGWDMHKDECPRLKKISPRVVPDAARILARLIYKLKRGGGQVKGYYTKTNFRVYKDLMSHYSDIKQDVKRMEHFTSLYNVLIDFIGEDVPNAAELLGMYGRLTVNGFSILDPEMIGIGTGIYLGVSVVDHSCSPNAVAVFEGTTIQVRSLVDMPDFNWSKVFITYIELLNSAEDRRQELMATYYFLCDCSRCKDIEEMKLCNSMLCQNNNCAEPVPIDQANTESGKLVSCPKCWEKVKPELLKEYLEVSEFVNTQLQDMKNFAYLDVCKICLAKHGEMFHPLNLQRVKLLDSAFESSVILGQWHDALGYGRLLLPGYRMYYGECHPLTGLLQLKMAKIKAYLGEVGGDTSALVRAAENILQTTHGKDHTLLKENLYPLKAQLHL